MTYKEIIERLRVGMKKNGFLIYLMIAICFGYTFGKDRALKHNAQELAQNCLSCELESR